jgi:hypothetical protein
MLSRNRNSNSSRAAIWGVLPEGSCRGETSATSSAPTGSGVPLTNVSPGLNERVFPGQAS